MERLSCLYRKKYKNEVLKVNFRDKTRIGWSGHIESFVFENGEKIESKIYTDLFFKHIMLRPSCGNCHYTNFKRPSDITLADFWGWEKTDPNINIDDKGISLIFVNTGKGCVLLDKIKDRTTIIPTEMENCIQPNLKHPTKFNPKWNSFEQEYKRKGFGYILKIYHNKNNMIVKKILKIVQRLLHNF